MWQGILPVLILALIMAVAASPKDNDPGHGDTPALAEGAKGTCPEGMISYWKFDEASGVIAHDSINENHATIHGPSWTTGQVGGALSFDGSNDYIEVPDDPSLRGMSELTMEVWVYPTSFSADYYGIIVKRDHWTPYTHQSYLVFVFGYPDPPHPTVQVYNDNGDLGHVGHTDAYLSTNRWYHMVGTYSGETVQLYVNGELCAEEPFDGGSISNAPHRLIIGAFAFAGSQSGHFEGLIDEVAIYNRALTPEEIQQHYDNGLEGKGYCYEEDTTPPEITLSGLLAELWPPNHKMVSMDLGLSVTDDRDPDPTVNVTIFSTEPDDDPGGGDGTTVGDVELVMEYETRYSSPPGYASVSWAGPWSQSEDEFQELLLRAERSGKGSGRVYTIAVAATDASENSSSEVETVGVVPHDQGGAKGKGNGSGSGQQTSSASSSPGASSATSTTETTATTQTTEGTTGGDTQTSETAGGSTEEGTGSGGDSGSSSGGGGVSSGTPDAMDGVGEGAGDTESGTKKKGAGNDGPEEKIQGDLK